MVRTSGADDTTLVAQAVAGDAAALEELVQRYEPRVYRFAMRVCRNQGDAREILQDTFVSVIRGLGSFRGDSQFATWLFRIVVNSCRKLHGRRAAARAREVSLDGAGEEGAERRIDPEPTDWSRYPEVDALSAELRERLEAAIDRLAPGYKGVFLLRDIEGFSTEETAHILKLSPQAIKTRLHRARLSLRKQLSEYVAGR